MKSKEKTKKKTFYTCQNCGAQRTRWEGRCSDCGSWNSYVEETFTEAPSRGWSIGQKNNSNGHTNSSTQMQTISLDKSIEEVQFNRIDTGFSELNRVLGGGLVAGSFVLLGGSPGIGKSTLLLQMAGGLAKNKAKVLYVSAEESVPQTGSRAQRLGIRSPFVEICSESNLENIINFVQKQKPDVLVVDSIQTIFLPDLEAAPGSVSQVRESAGHLMSLAKNEGIAIILIGHVTKDGSIAGPKVLEHMVDCVLSFEGDFSSNFRLLRSLKNRFGPTYELGVFRMISQGLEEVSNPSELFLEERGESLIGSAVFASMEGSRPLLCEVQSVTISSNMAMPRRTAIGIEVNRLHMLSAVLDRHLDLHLAQNDIFINVVGGLKLMEPSSDLAVVAALISTDARKELDPKTVFFGEVGLTGEVRAVSFAELRLKEAVKLGFTHFIVPASNKRHLEDFLDTMKKEKARTPANTLALSNTMRKISFVRNVRELQNLILN